ncbi:hypothetical protein BU23DRAFT_604761 [Bimuria novae-zelandiae CBS 107.79]|uniref:Uncharacterized protein n=1 Tax=Bimuria novae-zelandiae CBS 107.79 TaxID=1447943 RepID=A0A6A5UKK9_9PLEO|nr:hypothetical protein BU23DRAFT_604761 [Bimuria novae-zelandiae CBS 107.79]
MQYHSQEQSYQGTDIQDLIHTWISSEEEHLLRRITSAYNGNGHWEGWVQFELEYILNTHPKYENKFTVVTRDVGAYEGNDQCPDLILMDNNQRTIVELRCQRGAAPAELLVNEVTRDRNKLKELLEDNFRPAECIALGIALTKDAVVAMENHKEWNEMQWHCFSCANDGIWVFHTGFVVDTR